ncbi:MAG: hypothetical protein ABSC05_31745 [Candidatus Solibacter sp.]|jgi:hypothetical protein
MTPEPDIERMVEEEQERLRAEQPRKSGCPAATTGAEFSGFGDEPRRQPLPGICSNGRQLRDISNDALRALQAANDPPSLFARSGIMVAVGPNEKQQQVIRKVDADALCGYLARSADYFKMGKKSQSGNAEKFDCPPPQTVVRDIHSMAPGYWGFPPLEAVTDSPILRPDFSVLEVPGYDPVTKLYYAPDSALEVPPIPEEPSREHINSALALIEQVIGEFPFEDDGSKANAIAALLTPIVRPAIEAPVPMGLLDAPQAGTGKSLLCDVVSIIATGQAGRMLSAPKDEDEWRKVITTALMSGAAVAIFDNIVRPLQNADLCSVLTASIWADREMKTHNEIALPVRTTFLASGNNIRLAGDMPRRCFKVRLDAKCSQPYLRTGPAEGKAFAIQDLKAWTIFHRGALLAALLTLSRAWFVAGRPKPAVRPLGSFEKWIITIGGILEHAGINGFMMNAGDMYREADEESTQWEAFLLTLQELFPDPFTTAAVADELQGKTWDTEKHIAEPSKRAMQLRSALPDSLLEVADKDALFRRRLGKLLGERVERRYGKDQVHLKRGKLLHGSPQWDVRKT